MARDLYQRNLRVKLNPRRNKWAWVTVRGEACPHAQHGRSPSSERYADG
jgi:hypothetical protein